MTLPRIKTLALGAARLTVTASFLALAAGAIVAGNQVLAERADTRETPPPVEAMPVTTRPLALQASHEVLRQFSGQIEARQQTDLSFERAGTIMALQVREGDSVHAGQVLARLDIRLLQAERQRLEAQRAALEAQAELARRTNARQAELKERGFASAQVVDDTSLTLTRLEAELAGVAASLVAVDVSLSKSTLVAPFDGRIARRDVDAGTVATPGRAVLTVIENGAPRFRAAIDPVLADALRQEDAVSVRLPNGTHSARLAHMAPDLDPQTRARIAFFDLDAAKPPAGTTGSVEIVTKIAGAGAWVALSALRQGPRGTWTLFTVEDGRVTVEAAEILHVEADRAFVRGTFADGASYIPTGTHRLVPGQQVQPMEATAWAR